MSGGGQQKQKITPKVVHLFLSCLLAVYYSYYVGKHTPAWIVWDSHIIRNKEMTAFEVGLEKLGAAWPYFFPDLAVGLAVIGLFAFTTGAYLNRIMKWVKLGHTGDMAQMRSTGIQKQTFDINREQK